MTRRDQELPTMVHIPHFMDLIWRDTETEDCASLQSLHPHLRQLRHHLEPGGDHEMEPGYLMTDTDYRATGLDHHPSSSPSRRWKCELCSRGFNSKASLDYHSRMHQDPSKHYCVLCHHFIHSSKVSQHNLAKCARTANMEKKFECEECGKRFKGLASLQLHKAIHSEKKFMCKFCSKSFTQKGNMRTHIQKKHRQATETSRDGNTEPLQILGI